VYIIHTSHQPLQDREEIAAKTLFDVPELLEDILLGSPTRELLLARRMCKPWCEQVDEFPKIQRALFFRATSTSTIKYDRKFKRWLAAPASSQLGGVGNKAETRIVKPIINPLLIAPVFYQGEHGVFGMASIDLDQRPLSMAEKSYSIASLGRMQLTHPPVRKIRMREWGFSCSKVEVRNPSGVAVGDLAAQVEKHFQDCDKCKSDWLHELDNYGWCITTWDVRGFRKVKSPCAGYTGWKLLDLLGASGKHGRTAKKPGVEFIKLVDYDHMRLVYNGRT